MATPETFIVALLPDEVTARRAIRVSRQLKLLDDSKMVLAPDGDPPAIPHLSLIHVVLDPDRLDELAAAVERLAAWQRFTFEMRTELREAAGGYVIWEAFEKNLALKAKRVAKAVAPLRAGDVHVSWPMSDGQKKMHKRYGYPSVGKAFCPHITVGVLQPRVLPETLRAWPDYALGTFQSEPAQLVIGRAGDYGTLREVTRVVVDFEKF